MFSGANADGKVWRPLDGAKARSTHELSPESAVKAAKQYLEDNPSMTAERRKLRSLYETADTTTPAVEAPRRLFSPEPVSTFSSTYHASHPDVYQPKALSSQSPYYKSRFDDNISYRRSFYDVDAEPIYSSVDTGPTSSSGGGSSKFRVFQPKGLLKRRSRSVEKANVRSDSSEDLSTASGGYHYHYASASPASTTTATTYTSPLRALSPVSDYYHTTYHDTSGAAREPPKAPPDIRKQPAKSILKKTTNFNSSLDEDSGYRSSKYSSDPESITNRLDDIRLRTYASAAPKPLTFVEKLKRHLSSEKLGPASRRDEDAAPKIISSSRPTSYYSTTDKDTSLDSLDNDKPRKKKSLLELARRRTTEIRFGNGTSDSSGEELRSSKRPNSPLEKIKGFFTGTTGASTKISSRPKDSLSSIPTLSSRLDSTTSPHHSASSTTYSSTTGVPSYTPSYRKAYQTSHRPHAYMPMTKYSWYEDSSLY